MTSIADTITAAIRNERVIRFWYLGGRRGAVPMQRTVSPYELSEDGDTFLSFDHGREELRRFSLSNIVSEDIELPDEEYIKPIDPED